MAFPTRSRAIPQCSTCLRNYAWATLADSMSSTGTSLRQQIRGKKKMPNHSATVMVKLNQDVKTFGKKGALVPVERGRMRNQFFPQRIAEYVTIPELKKIRVGGVMPERDFKFGLGMDGVTGVELGSTEDSQFGYRQAVTAPIRTSPRIERLTPERSRELVDIFMRPHLDFYRQPIPEEKAEEPEVADTPPPEDRRRTASSAAADLLAARAYAAKTRAKTVVPRGIFGSVSTHDVLVAVRAAMSTNEEAARVILSESDIDFVDLLAEGENEAVRVKYLGEFAININIKGTEEPIRRTVRVIAQEE